MGDGKRILSTHYPTPITHYLSPSVKIAVIIPALNEEQALPATLAQVSRLGFDEVLVVDGGSSDRTHAIVQSLAGDGRWAMGNRQDTGALQNRLTHGLSPIVPRLALLVSSAERAKQMNEGAAHATADVLVFLHADTHLPDNARQAIEFALADPACVGGRFDVRFERDRGWAWLIARLISLRSRLSGIATGDQAIFARRSTFDQLGGFADLPLMEDVDFTRRLKRMGRTAALRACVITSFRRWEQCGPVRTICLMWALRFLYWLGTHPVRLHRFYIAIR
jgi:rSAM/selenodomain-associated transferase 2